MWGGNGRRDHDTGELGGVQRLEPGLGALEHRPHVLLEGLVVADPLVDHLVDRAVLAVVVDRHLHPVSPLVVPDRHRPGHRHERRIHHVRDVEQAEGDRHDALALEVVHVVDRHRVDRVVVEGVQRPHPPLQRVEDQVRHRESLRAGLRRPNAGDPRFPTPGPVDHATAIVWMPPTEQAAAYGNEAVPAEAESVSHPLVESHITRRTRRSR